jgi:hypothetical protein
VLCDCLLLAVVYTHYVVAQRGEAVASSRSVPCSGCLCWTKWTALCNLNEAARFCLGKVRGTRINPPPLPSRLIKSPVRKSPRTSWSNRRKADEIFFGYIVCMGLSTGMSRQNIFGIRNIRNTRNITDVALRTSAPVGAPRRPESPSGDISAGRASFGGVLGAEPRLPPALPGMIYFFGNILVNITKKI